MTTYTAQLQITAQSAWETWYAASEIATEKTEAAIAWYCETFFSERAQTTYTTIGETIGHLMIAHHHARHDRPPSHSALDR